MHRQLPMMRFAIFLLCFPFCLTADDRPRPTAADTPSEALKTKKSPRLSPEEFQARREAALAAFQADRGDAGEAELAALVPMKNKKSPEAQRSIAAQLTTVAFQARAAGDVSGAQRAATRALRAIERAERAWSDKPERLSELQLLRATLQSEFLGTGADAEAHLLEAARLDASNAAATKKALRIQQKRSSVESTAAPQGAVQ